MLCSKIQVTHFHSKMNTRLPLSRIFALCAASASIDLIIAVKGAYFVPAIYDSGVVSGEYGSMLLIFSPLLVLVFQNYLGSASDRCSCQWGRRKPFILGLTIAFLLGLILFPFSGDLANLAETYRLRRWILIVIILISTIMIDFNVSSVQVPLRAFLLDVLPQKQLVTGNIVFPVFALLGATAGFGIGSVNWPSLFSLSNSLSIQLKFVCGFSILITVILTSITLCSVKEQPPQQIIDVKQASTNVPTSNSVDHHDSGDRITQADEEIGSLKYYLEHYLSYNNITMLPYGSHITNTTEEHNSCCNAYKTVVDNICFIRYMSLSTAVLLTATFFTIVAFFTQIVFFTHYVGEVVFSGDVFAPENSTAYKNYTDGVKAGSLILAVSSTSGFLILLLLRPAIKYLGIRPLFILPYLLVTLQSAVLIINHSLVIAIIFSPAIYILLLQYLTFPHILISMYQAKGLLLRKSWPHSDTNLMGRSCSLIMIVTELSKITSLAVNGPLMMAHGSAVSVMIFTCVCSFVGAIVACFVTIPSIASKQKIKPEMNTPSSVTKPAEELLITESVATASTS